MNCIEIIEIRVLHKSREKLEIELQRILTDSNKEVEFSELKIYSRINLDTDFVVLIMNSSGSVKDGESQLGIRLTEGLKDYGMVNYSKWNELESGAARSDENQNLTNKTL
jgi:hypothetical protein